MIKINLLGDTLAQAGKKTDKPDAAPVYADAQGSGRSAFPIAGVVLGVILLLLVVLVAIYGRGKPAVTAATTSELAAG